MKAFMPARLPTLLRLPLAMALAGACVGASADGTMERVRQRDKLIVAVGYVAPEYAAGAKFRTPEGIEAALAEELAKRLRTSARMMAATPAKRAQLLAAGNADIALVWAPDAEWRRSAALIPTGYSAAAMAIMRSDTPVKSWEQLKGRTVCLSEGSPYAGTIAAKYGAVETLFKAPADSLLALRTGRCDAAVHESAMLEELIKLPEWKKFSASLPPGPRTPLLLAVPANAAQTQAFLKRLATEWQATGYLDQLVKKAVRNIAFEVYLDQNVPDCH